MMLNAMALHSHGFVVLGRRSTNAVDPGAVTVASGPQIKGVFIHKSLDLAMARHAALRV
jgi:hypothetical protein